MATASARGRVSAARNIEAGRREPSPCRQFEELGHAFSNRTATAEAYAFLGQTIKLSPHSRQILRLRIAVERQRDGTDPHRPEEEGNEIGPIHDAEQDAIAAPRPQPAQPVADAAAAFMDIGKAVDFSSPRT